MTQTQKGAAVPSATARAEQLLTHAGERLGILAGQATLYFQQTGQAFRQEAGHRNTPESASVHQTTAAQPAQTNPPTMERAEELVDQLGQRIGRWALENNQRIRRALARLQEDAEDLWVEAQDRYSEWKDQREGQ
jgi:hypothetical protein